MTKEFELALSVVNDILPNSSGLETAYIKQETLNNNAVWSIYNLRGEKMGYAETREMAFAVAKQNAYNGMNVH